ncbi:glutaredoxin-1 [Microcaecilia unicolor]|uniref:Glutaredoxin-1 n=1 Tax=Microcaecilia unicolor TaxID=1415580 RepID=A0A6P7XC64_9AMPH|nr:glutaredoxin-1 [Microcaecilia unicolor]
MAQNFVVAKIQKDKVSVFIKPTCPYCSSAKGILNNFKFKPGHLEFIDISSLAFMDEIQQYFFQTTGERTVPRVYIGDKCIGGCSDLTSLANSGRLEGILQSIGALQ